MIYVLESRAANTIQDLGRPGHMDIGVGKSGAMDELALIMANLLVGNIPGAAGIEIAMAPFRARIKRDAIIAITGADFSPTLDGRALPLWSACFVRAGQKLELRKPPRAGARSYLAIDGGIEVPSILGSRSTDLKGGFGGMRGRGLQAGDRIPARPNSFLPSARESVAPELAIPAYGEDQELKDFSAGKAVTVRVLPAAEYAWLDEESLEAFLDSDWLVTADSNRLGYRLSGPTLSTNQQRKELMSHALALGVIQLPPGGQPIVQLKEGNTSGGYPKLGVVIRADMRVLAQVPLGGRLRFAPVTRDEAIAALQRERKRVDACWDQIEAGRRLL